VLKRKAVVYVRQSTEAQVHSNLEGQRLAMLRMSDAALLAAIRAVLAASPFYGEGHRKVWARLRRRRHPHLAQARAPADARERSIGSDPGWIGARAAGA
jgi:hypothetical protein